MTIDDVGRDVMTVKGVSEVLISENFLCIVPVFCALFSVFLLFLSLIFYLYEKYYHSFICFCKYIINISENNSIQLQLMLYLFRCKLFSMKMAACMHA